jgi:PAS domain S-box-containing protein
VTIGSTTLSVAADAPDTVRTGPVPGFADPVPAEDVIVVPVEGGGHRYGTVAVRRAKLGTRDTTVLAPLAGTLGAALAAGEHLDRLVEETSKLQAIVEQSTEGILILDGDGVVQMWSQAFTDLTGIGRAEATGQPLAALLDIVGDVDLIPVSAAEPKVAAELTVRRPDGEERRLRLAHSAVYADRSGSSPGTGAGASGDGVLVRDVVVASDLTREHRTERLKSDFLATVSHELRTPLTPIIGYLDLLRTKGEQVPPRKRADILDLLADRAGHLSRLVEDLLTVSRASDGDLAMHIQMGEHDLNTLVHQVVRDLASPRLELDLPATPVEVRCDAGRTVQVLANLVGNALKYSPDPAPVSVRLRVDGGRAYVEVQDRGRGIPSDQQERVFEKFHRVEDPMTMSTGGTGLGLYIARRLAEAMGGTVGLVSTLGVGSTFTLSLDVTACPD